MQRLVRAASLSPIGTSGSYAGYLLVEIPLPWPRDAGDTAEGAALGPLIGPLRYRLQAIVPAEPDADPAERRVILHTRRPGVTGFSGYRRFESRAGDSLTGTVAALIAAAAGDAPSELESPAVDVLVCTHGTRDSCCGKRGAQLALDLAASGLPGRTSGAPVTWAAIGSPLPFWCCRRARSGATPTPTWSDGSYAGRASSPTWPAYRGCPGLDSPQVQALEAEVLRQVGWSLLDRQRTGSFEGINALLTWEEDGQTVTWGGEVRPGRTLPSPGCLEPLSSSGKSETEWPSPRCIAARTRARRVTAPGNGELCSVVMVRARLWADNSECGSPSENIKKRA